MDDPIHFLLSILALFIDFEGLKALFNEYGYAAVFVVSLIGTMSMFVSLPYLHLIYYAGSTQMFNPVFLGIAAGAGAALGEMTLYFLARGGRYALPENLKRRMDSLRILVDKYGSLVVFLLAVTPIPDDIIYPVLGFMRYSIGKILVASFMGKTILSTIIAYAGFYSYEIIKQYIGQDDFTTTVIVIVLSIVFTVIVFMIDWEKYVSKFVEEDESNISKT